MSVATCSASSLLETIAAASRRGVEVRSATRPMTLVAGEIARPPRGDAFLAALTDSPSPRIIAECKRRSPSRGILRGDYDAAAIAARYASAGAAAISVLTEPTFFDGSPEHLRAVRQAVALPLLRKDFIVTEYQLVEAAALGADAALLIVGALDDALLRVLMRRCEQLGLAALVEVHDAAELTRALAAGARIVGVNSRNLHTLTVDPETLDRAAAEMPDDVVAVAESGLKAPSDLQRLSDLGYDAFLVGERLVTASEPDRALRELRGE
jgi:indole-3-glycerol phosphate synthase